MTWRLFYCQGGTELRISEDLRARDVSTFCPFERFKRHSPKGHFWEDKPLYPSYVFAKTDRFASTKLIRGVIGVVSRGTRPLSVPDNLLLKMSELCDAEGVVRRLDTTKNSFAFRAALGDKVLFKKKSPLYGIIGEIISLVDLDESGQIKALVEIFGRLTEISMHFSEVEELVGVDERAVA